MCIYGIIYYRCRKDLDKLRCTRYEQCVNDVTVTVSSLINPFTTEHEQLVSLASGFVLNNDIATQLLEAEQHGESQFINFVRENLLGPNPDLYVKMKRNKVPTFSSGQKKSVKDSKGKAIQLKMNRDLFARLLLVAKTRQINMELVLSFSLGTYPLSLATATGSLVKTGKSKMFSILEGLLIFCQYFRCAFTRTELLIFILFSF